MTGHDWSFAGRGGGGPAAGTAEPARHPGRCRQLRSGCPTDLQGRRARPESIHELRHSCASPCGHSPIRVTKKVYGHLLPPWEIKVAEAMGRTLPAGQAEDPDGRATRSATDATVGGPDGALTTELVRRR